MQLRITILVLLAGCFIGQAEPVRIPGKRILKAPNGQVGGNRIAQPSLTRQRFLNELAGTPPSTRRTPKAPIKPVSNPSSSAQIQSEDGEGSNLLDLRNNPTVSIDENAEEEEHVEGDEHSEEEHKDLTTKNPALGNNLKDPVKNDVDSKQLFFDENAEPGKQDLAEKIKPNSKDRTPPSKQGPPGKEKPTGKILPNMKPICFLFDPSYASTAATIVKDVVDEYAACGVMVISEVFMIKPNYSYKADGILKNSKTACPIGKEYGVKETAIITGVNHDNSADDMCGSYENFPDDHIDLTKRGKPDKDTPTKNVGGCAELIAARHFNLSEEDQKRLDKNRNLNAAGADKAKHGNRKGTVGEPGQSIVDAGQSGSTFKHELQHINGGVNTGDGDGRFDHGHGTQRAGDPTKNPSGASANKFTSDACKHIFSAAQPNTLQEPYFKDFKPQDYFTAELDGSKQWDIMAGENFFTEHVPPGLKGDPGKPITSTKSKPPSTGEPRKPASSNGPAVTKGGGSSTPVKSATFKHPKKLTSKPPSSQDKDFFGNLKLPGGEVSGAGGTSSYAFDEDAKSAEDEARGAITDDFFTGGGSGDTQGLGFNEGAGGSSSRRLIGGALSGSGDASSAGDSENKKDSIGRKEGNELGEGGDGRALAGAAAGLDAFAESSKGSQMDEEFLNKTLLKRKGGKAGPRKPRIIKAYTGQDI